MIDAAIESDVVELAETTRKEFPDHRIDVPRIQFEERIDYFLTQWLVAIDGDPYGHHGGGVLFAKLANGECVRITINRTNT